MASLETAETAGNSSRAEEREERRRVKRHSVNPCVELVSARTSGCVCAPLAEPEPAKPYAKYILRAEEVFGLFGCLLACLQPPAAAAAAAWWSCCLAELPAVTQSKGSGHEVHGCPLMAKEMPEADSRTGSTS